MTQQETARLTDFDAVVDALQRNDRFLVVTHENPDGDALGSMLAATLGLRSLGKDAVMHLAGRRAAAGRVRLHAARRRRPPSRRTTSRARVLLALDCANERRLGPDPALLERAALVVDVDHHHDNTRFGAVNLIVPTASSTAEIVRELLGASTCALTPDIAEALYVGVVTDTGRFQYANTTPKALRLAAELVEAGADVHGVFKQVYETVQFAKLKLLARALERAQVYEGGRLVVSYLLRVRLRRGRGGRAVLGGDHRLPAPDRGRRDRGADPGAADAPAGPTHRVSLRSSRDEIDVSAIARHSQRRRPPAGGGVLERGLDRGDHRLHPPRSSSPRQPRASPMPPRASRPVGVALVDKPAGPSSFALVAALRRRTGARTGHTGTLDPFATGLLVLLSGAGDDDSRRASSGWTSATSPRST